MRTEPVQCASFLIRELDYGMTRSDDTVLLYKQGERETYFSIERQMFWEDPSLGYEYRARLPQEFKNDDVPDEVLQWRMLAAQNVASHIESPLNFPHMRGKVDIRDLKTFDGRRPSAIFW